LEQWKYNWVMLSLLHMGCRDVVAHACSTGGLKLAAMTL
jgi:hypothetical protein